MNNEIMQAVTGEKSKAKYNLFLACDSIYYEEWAIDCAKSVLYFAPWIHVHIHLVNHRGEKFLHPRITYTEEILPIHLLEEEPKIIYFQSVRFLRALELFDDDQHVMVIDSDSMAIKDIPFEKFVEITKFPSQLFNYKTARNLATCVTFGIGESGRNFKSAIKNELLSIPIPQWKGHYDQACLDKIRSRIEINPIDSFWMTFKKLTGIFYSAKGRRKGSMRCEEVRQLVLEQVK